MDDCIAAIMTLGRQLHDLLPCNITDDKARYLLSESGLRASLKLDIDFKGKLMISAFVSVASLDVY